VTAAPPPAASAEVRGRWAGAAVSSGLRRGAVGIFLPLALAGQAIAWIEYAVSGLYRPWSWVKIGLAYTLTSVRVPFRATTELPSTAGAPPTVEVSTMLLATGALTVAVVVLAFRSGREQAHTYAPGSAPAAAAAGAAVGLGLALPMFVAGFLVRLSFPNLGIDLLHPVLPMAFVQPLVVAGAVGAVGGLAAGGGPDAGRWGARLTAAARGGFAALWWGMALAFVAFLALASVERDATAAYGRAIGGWGTAGAVAVVHHALVLPNQSAMVLATSMGSPTELLLNDEVAARVSLTGVEVIGPLRRMLADPDGVTFPRWYLAFGLVPLAATVVGGRTAAGGHRAVGERVIRGAGAGLVFAVLVGIVVAAASIALPIWIALFDGPPTIGPDPWRTTGVAVAWGVVGGAAGALIPERRATSRS
jgi:hypothetical protein